MKPSTIHQAEFPFVEIRDDDGDYFPNVRDAMQRTHLGRQHIWSVIESDGHYTFGPPHHIVNVLGYIATDEAHDGDTYYEEP